LQDKFVHMKFVKLFIVTFLFVFLYACSGTLVNVVKVDNKTQPSGKSGFYYALPRTFIRVDIVVNKTEQIKGPYSEYAEKYLGLTNVIKSNSTSYEISEYKLSTFAEPDPQQFYFVRLKNACCTNYDRLKLSLSETGILMSAHALVDTSASENQTYVFEEEGNVYPDLFKSYTDLNLFEKVDTIIEKVNVDSVLIEKMTFKRSLVEKTPEQKAREAADFFIKVKDNRFNLISGFQEVNYDKETFKYMNEELQKMENDYRKLFTGIIFSKKITYSFIFLPSPAKPEESAMLFRFSTLRGVLGSSDAYGEPVYLNILKSGNTDTLNVYQVKKDSLKIRQHGFYYRIPDYAEVSLSNSNEENIRGKFLIAQYGVLTYLPASMRFFDLYKETGGIKNIGGK